jgi:hypothetical protein
MWSMTQVDRVDVRHFAGLCAKPIEWDQSPKFSSADREGTVSLQPFGKQRRTKLRHCIYCRDDNATSR